MRTLVVILALMFAPTVMAGGSSQDAPLLVQDASGATRIKLGGGTALDNLELATGKLALLDDDDNWGDITVVDNPVAPTTSISVTFGTAEPDTNYNILLTTTGMTQSYAPLKGTQFTVGDKYIGSFEIRNPAALDAGIGATWIKYRTVR